jgi:hypothetical protein
MNSKFSFLIFNIGFVNNRLSLLQDDIDFLCELDRLEMDSLIRYRIYLTQKATLVALKEQLGQLAGDFLEDNGLISTNDIVK